MIQERHDYRRVRWAFLTITVVAWAALAFFMLWWWRWLPYSLGQASDCGCVSFTFHLPPSFTWLGFGLTAGSLVLLGRWIFTMVRHIQRWQTLRRVAITTGRWITHARTGISYWLLENQRSQAYTVGGIGPEIIVTTGLVKRLSGSELEAVLCHEAAHVRSHDPLWSALIDATGSMLWWPSWLREWAAAAYSWRELVADAEATHDYHHTHGLSGAVVKLCTPLEPSTAVQFSPNHDRVEKLLDPTWTSTYRLWSKRSLTGLLVGVGLIVGGILGAKHVQASLPPYPAGQCPRPIQAMLCRSVSAPATLALRCIHQGGWQCRPQSDRFQSLYVPIVEQ